MKKKILVICPFPVGVAAGQRLKYEQYFDEWQDEGYDVTVSSFMSKKMWSVVYKKGYLFYKIYGTFYGYWLRCKTLLVLKKYDAVYIFMWVTPFGTSFFECLYRYLSRHIIFDVEDNVFMEVHHQVNPFVKFLKNRVNKVNFLIRKSNQVITSSPFLNDYCLTLNEYKKCTYISASVDVDRFLPINDYKNDSFITIGWTGTWSSKMYLDLLRDTFIELRNRCNFKLRIIGNFEYELEGIDLEVIQWTEESEVKDLQGIDIGLYPLATDKWVRGKSGLKAIQYMAFGLPTVATNFGTTSNIISHFENGILVQSDNEWVDALELLIKDPGLRRKLGTAARESVVNNYSTTVIKKQYLMILNNI
jgi:glycosyltransferase involved in cell wall biosynthesis